MKDICFKILRRTLRMLIPTFVFSAIVTALNVFGILNTRLLVLALLVPAAIIFFIFNLRFSKNNYFKVRDLKLYFLTEGASIAIYTFFVVIIYVLCDIRIFTWLFSLTRLVSYAYPPIPTVYGIAFFILLNIFSSLIALLGMKFRVMYHDNPEK